MLLKNNMLSRDRLRNILLIQLGDIGDVVLTMPAIRALKENFPQANIVVAVRQKAKELIEDCPWAAGVIAIQEKKGSWKEMLSYQTDFMRRLRAFRFDMAIDMKTGDRGAILALLSGARQRVGLYAQDGILWRNRVFTHLALPYQAPGRHMAEHYLSLLEHYGIMTEHIWPELRPSEDRVRGAWALLRNEGVTPDRSLIAVQPFSLWPYKEWRPENYAGLINWLVSNYEVSVVITGSQEERTKADALVKECKRCTYNLAGKTSVGALGAVFGACKMFIGVDSAGLHIAAAAGVPTIGIFGPSSTVDWAPRGDRHRFVRKDLPCVPCQNKGCEGSDKSRCLDELTLEEVQAVVREHMERISQPVQKRAE